MKDMFHLEVKTRSGSVYHFGENGCVLRTSQDVTTFLGVVTRHFAVVGQPMSLSVVLRRDNELVAETWTTTKVTLITRAISLEEVAA